MDEDQTAAGTPPHTITAPPPRPIARRQTTRPVFFSFPNTPTQSQISLPPSDDEDGWGSEPTSPVTTQPTTSRFQSTRRRVKNKIIKFLKGVNEFKTVPMWAALASLIVACIQPFQHALDQHMQPVKGALASAGNCSIPITLIVLGGYFYNPPEESKSIDHVLPSTHANGHPDAPMDSPNSRWSVSTITGSLRGAFNLGKVSSPPKKPATRPGETKTVLVAILSRMVLTPLVLLPFVAGLAFFDLHKIMEEYVSRALQLTCHLTSLV
jgi:auxin efflux carrier family protein